MSFREPSKQSWGVASSPGAHDATTARAAVLERLSTRLSAEDLELVDHTLRFAPTPYSRADLGVTRSAVQAALQPLVPNVVAAFDCNQPGAVRVGVYNVPDTPAARAQVEPLLAPFGDKVALRFDILVFIVPTTPGTPPPPEVKPTVHTVPTPSVQPLAPRLRDHVSLPSTAHCVRGGTLSVKPGKQVARLRLTAGGRAASARDGKAAKLKLKARRTKVAVTATLEDGSVVQQSFNYRRCG